MNSTSISERTDQALVMAVRSGDDRSVTELYDRYARRVFALVDSQMSDWLRSVTEPEDIVQSVFKSMFRGLQGGHFEAPPGNTLWSLIAVVAVRKTRRRATHHLAQGHSVEEIAEIMGRTGRNIERSLQRIDWLVRGVS